MRGVNKMSYLNSPTSESISDVQNTPTSETEAEYESKTETLYYTVPKDKQNTININIIIPHPTEILDIKVIDTKNNYHDIDKFIGSISGPNGTGINNFRMNLNQIIKPGDYIITIYQSTSIELTGVSVKIKCDKITKIYMCQIIYGIYKILGYEPSHLYKFSIKTENNPIPIHRKIRQDITKLLSDFKTNLESLKKIDNIPENFNKLLTIANKKSSTELIQVYTQNQSTFQKQIEDIVESINVKLSDLSLNTELYKIKEIYTQNQSTFQKQIGDIVESINDKLSDLSLNTELYKIKDIYTQNHSTFQKQIGDIVESINDKLSDLSLNSNIETLNTELYKIKDIIIEKICIELTPIHKIPQLDDIRNLMDNQSIISDINQIKTTMESFTCPIINDISEIKLVLESYNQCVMNEVINIKNIVTSLDFMELNDQLTQIKNLIIIKLSYNEMISDTNLIQSPSYSKLEIDINNINKKIENINDDELIEIKKKIENLNNHLLTENINQIKKKKKNDKYKKNIKKIKK